MVVARSLGAVYAPLIAAERRIYLCPTPAGPLAGAAANPIRPGFPGPLDRPDGTIVWESEAAITGIYPRLPREQGEALARRLHPAGRPAKPYPDIDRTVPSTLIYAAHDEFFEPAWSRAAARAAFGTDALELDAGHFPMIECPDKLAALLVAISD